MYQLLFTKQAQKDAKKLASSNLKPKTEEILHALRENPFPQHPRYEKLAGDLTGAYSCRINIQHRIVYQVLQEEKIIKVIRMWTHYE